LVVSVAYCVLCVVYVYNASACAILIIIF
jgi:hypothetical protein